MPSGMSPISSRKSVAALGQLEPPFFLAVGAGERPRSWPKSSLSSSGSGSAAQLTATSGPSRVTSLKWIASATSSLPVPVSPVTSTLHDEDATRATRSKTSPMPGLRPKRLW